ncbi:hypothetical protein ACQ4PT_052273 [Festuca glaucescens]
MALDLVAKSPLTDFPQAGHQESSCGRNPKVQHGEAHLCCLLSSPRTRTRQASPEKSPNRRRQPKARKLSRARPDHPCPAPHAPPPARPLARLSVSRGLAGDWIAGHGLERGDGGGPGGRAAGGGLVHAAAPRPGVLLPLHRPRSYSKWTSRLKCNLYYYRTNYFILIMFILGLGFLWKPVAILAAFMTGFSIAFLNDSFAVTFNEKVTRTVRQFSPHLAAKMRPPITPVIRGRPSSKRSIHICGRPRWLFVLLFSAVSCMLWLTSCSLLTVLWALLIALLATVLHASFRTPNLKARLNTFREEFRAVWRNYSEL